jgi:hypothetical protein
LTLRTPPTSAAAVESEEPVTSVLPVRKNTQRKKARVVHWEDNIVATMDDSDVIPLVGMISGDLDPEPTLANFATRDPTLAIKQHVSFNKEERTFTCLTTERTCTVLRAKTSGTLLKVHCNLCKQTFSYSQIPVDWRAVSLWCKDPKFLPEEARASYTPPPVGIHTQGGFGGSNAAAAT